MNLAFIMMGPSGGGKSSWIKKNLENYRLSSADDYPGLYKDGKFHPSLLGDAHAFCLRSFVEGLQSGANTICVDNTNTTIWEIAPYIALANAYNYEIKIVACFENSKICHERNVHGVPESSIKKMIERMYKTMNLWPTFWPKILDKNLTILSAQTFKALAMSDVVEKQNQKKYEKEIKNSLFKGEKS